MTETTHEPQPLNELAAALAAFQAEMPTVPKKHTATVKSDKGNYSYTYAGLADISEAAMPLLAKHGLSFSALPGGGVLTGILLHESGQSLSASLPITTGTPQQIGSSLTYMRRYLLGCMTGLVTDDDDDGRIASSQPRQRPAAKNSGAVAPPAPGQAVEPPPAAPESDPTRLRAAAQKRMGEAFKEKGITEKPDMLHFATATIGSEVKSSAELSVEEIEKIIAALESA